MKVGFRRLGFISLLLLMIGSFAGCATDSDNLSERPWNSPKTWETGLPSNINEGR